jgi:hypothetical protein
MTHLDRLLEESIPRRPNPPDPTPPTHRYWTPEEQARHWNDLAEAIREIDRNRRRPTTTDTERTTP